MRGWKTRMVGGNVAAPATRGSGLFVEALESRTLLSAVDLSGTFSKFVASAKAGKKYTETISVSNAGSSTVAGTLPILVETSADGSLTDATTPTTIPKTIKIKPGKSAKIALTLTAPAEASSFYLVVELDPQNTLGTENPATNTFASPSKLTVKTGLFKRGAIKGQNGWGEYDFVTSPVSTADVSTKVSPPTSGNKDTILINRAVGEDIGVAPPTNVTSTTPFTVTAQVEVNYKTTVNGPFFGLNLYGDNGAANIGSFGVDSADGKVYDSANGSGVFLLSDGSAGSPAPLTAGTWNTFKIVADFASGAGGPVTLNYYLNNANVDTETISAGTVGSFSYAYIWSQAAFAGVAADAAGSAAFDNYSLTTTAPSTVPATGLTFP